MGSNFCPKASCKEPKEAEEVLRCIWIIADSIERLQKIVNGSRKTCDKIKPTESTCKNYTAIAFCNKEKFNRLKGKLNKLQMEKMQ